MTRLSLRCPTLSCLAFLGCLPFVLFWRVTLFQRVFADGDLFSYNFPLLCTIARQWKAGAIPLWNPYIFGGTPLLGNMQGGVFYPLNLMFLIGPEWKAYQYSILLHYSLAGVFTFLYLRTLSLSRVASLFGGTVFMLGGFGMGTLGHVSTLRTYPWLPLVLGGFEMWRKTFDRRYVILAGLAMGAMLVAGHPQIPLYAMALSAAYALCFAACATRHERVRLALGYVAAFGLAAGLAAVQLLPTLQLAAEEYLRPTDRSYEYFVNFSLSPVLLLNLVFPRILPTDESELAVYVGISTLVLVLLGALRRASRHVSHRRFFSWVAIVALILALGKWSLFSRPLFAVPLYNLFTSPARNLFEFDFSVAVLSAMGLQGMMESGEDGRTRRRAVLGFVLLAGLATLAVYQGRGLGSALDTDLGVLTDPGWMQEKVIRRLPILLASLAVVWFLPTARRRRQLAASGLLALLVVDLASYGTTIYRLDPPSVYTNQPPVVGFLKARAEPSRILTLDQPEDDTAQARAMLAPDGNAIHGIESINGFDSMMLRQIDDASGHVMPTYGLIAGPNTYELAQFRRFMDLLGARYVVTPANKALELPGPRYRAIYEDGTVRVFENAEALPRFFVAPRWRAVTRAQALEALELGGLDGPLFDPRSLGLLEVPESRGHLDEVRLGPRPPTAGPAKVTLVASRPGAARVRIESQTGGVLIHATSFSRGWKARVDGSYAPLLRADGLVQGLPLPPGRHEVAFEYRPTAFLIGAWISALSCAMAGIGMAIRSRPTHGRIGS